MPQTVLDKRANPPRPLLLFVSTGGHLFLLLLFLFEPRSDVGLPREPQENSYSVILISPQGDSFFPDAMGPVFPKSEEGSSFDVSQLTETALVDEVPEPVEHSEPQVPPGLDNPEDCLLKKVKDICPNADLPCIAGYMAYCVRLY